MDTVRKKILFFLPYLRIGGIERAFVTLYHTLRLSGSDVDICLNLPGGCFEQFLPSDTSFILPYQACEREYDIAVSFAQSILPHVWAPFVHAKKKIQWLHSNFAYESIDNLLEKSASIDHFILVSEEALHTFVKRFPEAASRAECIYNLADAHFIRQAAHEAIPDPFPQDGIPNILSVARLSPIKALDRSIRILHRLAIQQVPCRWYIVGEGLEHFSLAAQIESLKLQDSCFLLGSRINPFPYMLQADLIVFGSLSESFNITLLEAKVLAKPILTTQVPGAQEQITSSVNGLIVDNNEQALFDGLDYLVTHPEERARYSTALHDFTPDNSATLLRLQELFNLKKAAKRP